MGQLKQFWVRIVVKTLQLAKPIVVSPAREASGLGTHMTCYIRHGSPEETKGMKMS